MRLIPPSAVARNYGIDAGRLHRWRALGIGPEYFRLGSRTIRYYTGDLEDWFNEPANMYLYNVTGHVGVDTQREPGGRAG